MSGFYTQNVRELGSQVPDFLHVWLVCVHGYCHALMDFPRFCLTHSANILGVSVLNHCHAYINSIQIPLRPPHPLFIILHPLKSLPTTPTPPTLILNEE